MPDSEIPSRYYEVRHLLWHAESECLFEVFNRRALQQCLGEGCDQVTGMQLYEQRFRELKSKEKSMPRKQLRNREATTTGRTSSQKENKSNTPKTSDASDQPLHTKYRPQHFTDVIGHDLVINSLMDMMKKSTVPHCYLFTGPAGIGKTTLARIIASKFDCTVNEIDAAVHTGVDDMRDLLETLAYKGLGDTPNKMVIVDECFAENTRVNTPSGLVPIQNLKVGDTVIGAQGANRIKGVLKKQVAMTRVIKVNLANGVHILCSEEHPFLTSTGWVFAKDLTHGKSIHTTSSNIQPQMLEMWDKVYEQRRRGTLLQQVQENSLAEEVPGMWKAVSEYTFNLLKNLWKFSCSKKTILPTTTRVEARNKRSARQIETRKARSSRSYGLEVFTKNVGKQSNVSKEAYQKNDEYQGTEWDTTRLGRETRGQWDRHDKSTGSFAKAFEVCCRVCNQYWQFLERRFPAPLQSRLSFPCTEISNRSEWQDTQIKDWEVQGSEESCKTKNTGMASVTCIERGHRAILGNGAVSYKQGEVEVVDCYDLEVENHPSFSVEGLIVHNCHMLSKSAWGSLLKATEQPPQHVFFVFCTTEDGKVPDTMVTRCQAFNLKPLRNDDLMDLIEYVCEKERLDTPESVLKLVARSCNGSPRQALTMLANVADCQDENEAAALLEAPMESKEIIDLARALVAGDLDWKKVQTTIKAMSDQNSESVRIVIVNYLNACLLNAKGDRDVPRLLNLLASFSKPLVASDKWAGILLAIGDDIFPA